MTNALIIDSSKIRQIDGLYSLNDLHKASGNEERNKPKFWLSNKQTQDLSDEIQKGGILPFKVIRGASGGTYACRELVIAYAAWISPEFHLKVIRVFLSATDPARTEKPKIGKYHYPKSLLNQRFFNGGTNSVRLYGSEVAHPKFISPTLDLFNRIESEGGNVDGCRKEFDSMRKIIKSYTEFLEDMQYQMLDVRLTRY